MPMPALLVRLLSPRPLTSLFCFNCSTAAKLAPVAPPDSRPSPAGAVGAAGGAAAAAPAAACGATVRLRLLALAGAAALPVAGPLGCLRVGAGVASLWAGGTAAGWRCTALVAAWGESSSRCSSYLHGWVQQREAGITLAFCFAACCTGGGRGCHPAAHTAAQGVPLQQRGARAGPHDTVRGHSAHSMWLSSAFASATDSWMWSPGVATPVLPLPTCLGGCREGGAGRGRVTHSDGCKAGGAQLHSLHVSERAAAGVEGGVGRGSGGGCMQQAWEQDGTAVSPSGR